MSALADYTAKPRVDQLRDILAGLNDERNVLLVLNHPYWDAEAVGPVFQAGTDTDASRMRR